MKKIIDKFLKVFDGYKLAYGQYQNIATDESGKVNGRAKTIPMEYSDEIVEKHLSGNGTGLGLIPLKKNNMLKFAAIDLDIKGNNSIKAGSIKEIEKQVEKLGLPLLACQSKSKGVHLYCFTKKEVSANLLVKRMKEWASLLGYGTHEIFPKQTSRLSDKDIGNWINLPYYQYEDTVRFAVNKGKKLTIEKFFELVEVMRISEDELKNFKKDDIDETYNDAPPCLQVLMSKGIEEGSRNIGLYNFAVYFKNKYPDNWNEKVMEANGSIVKPALDSNEVETIIKGVNKKKYFYKCSEYPLCQYCNKTECQKRKFGIGTYAEKTINFDNLTKYVAGDDSEIWYAEFQGIRVQLTTEEILCQQKLQKKLLGKINKVFYPMKQIQWLKKIEELIETCLVIEDPKDASVKGKFNQHLENFLETFDTEKSGLLRYTNYKDEKKNIIYFRIGNLDEHLTNKKFPCERQKICHLLREAGADNKSMRIGNKVVSVWFMEAPEVYNEEVDSEVKI